MYDSTMGRWISQDPLGIQIPDPPYGVEVEQSPFTEYHYSWEGKIESPEELVRYPDYRTGKWVIPGDDAGESNLYRYVNNAPTDATDPSGMDVWIEGGSGNEPPGHLSLAIGNPLGAFTSFSFGVENLLTPWIGRVYEDVDKGGAILADHYLSCPQATDNALIQKYQGLIGTAGFYGPGSTCREWSFEQFAEIEKDPATKKAAPPNRVPEPWPGWYKGVAATSGLGIFAGGGPTTAAGLTTSK